MSATTMWNCKYFENVDVYIEMYTSGFCRLMVIRGWSNQQRSSVCVTRINLGLMINAGMLLASNKRLIFGGPVIALGLTGKSLSAIK